jgi:hypothetical protein
MSFSSYRGLTQGIGPPKQGVQNEEARDDAKGVGNPADQKESSNSDESKTP